METLQATRKLTRWTKTNGETVNQQQRFQATHVIIGATNTESFDFEKNFSFLRSFQGRIVEETLSWRFL
jgi:hypothetical protein